MKLRTSNLDFVSVFLNGVRDAFDQSGHLCFGATFSGDQTHFNDVYDRGANVGEWVYDLVNFNNVMRWPWVMRKESNL